MINKNLFSNDNMIKKYFAPVEKFKDLKEIHDWAEKNFKDWRDKKLTADEKDVLENYFNYQMPSFRLKITEYLEDTQGELVTKEHPKYDEYILKYKDLEQLNNYIKTMDKSISKAFLPSTINTFERVNESRVLRKINILRNHEGKIDLDIFAEISKDFHSNDWENANYINCSVLKDSKQTSYPILFKYKLGKGINATHFKTKSSNPKNLDIIVGRKNDVEFKGAKIINEKGIETMLMEFEINKH